MTRRETLTREKVLHAAMTLVDEEGLGGLSMRRLATALNVHVMSLYNHVSDKADLLDGIAEHVFDQVELPDPGLAWPEQVRAVALSMYRAFCRHPAVPVALVTDQANPASVRALEPFDRLVGALYQAGFDDRRARQALSAVTGLVFGSLLESTHGFAGDPDSGVSEATSSAYLRRIDPAKLPNFSRLLQQRTPKDFSPQEDFEQALDILVRGLVAAADQT
jgi:TetR/AcrR family transcriptional regulator, tetracycline repressor protein